MIVNSQLEKDWSTLDEDNWFKSTNINIKTNTMNKIQNTVNLIGRTGIDPVMRTFENGVKLAKFSLATNETITEVNGKKVQTQWHNVVAWGKKAELVEKYVKKGQLLAVDGKLINRVYHDALGNNRKLTEIQVNEVLLITPKSNSSETEPKVIALSAKSKKKSTQKKAS
jgi:single-strand DNA-binding protein